MQYVIGGVRGLRDGGIEKIFGGINAGLRDWPINLAGIRDSEEIGIGIWSKNLAGLRDIPENYAGYRD